MDFQNESGEERTSHEGPLGVVLHDLQALQPLL